MCKVIAVSNQKGGVGKSSIVANLGIGLALNGKKVCLIDADPQGSLNDDLICSRAKGDVPFSVRRPFYL